MIICNDCQLEVKDERTAWAAPGIDDSRLFCKSCFDKRFEYERNDSGHLVVIADRFEVKV